MDEFLKTKEELIAYFDMHDGLIEKAERAIAIMAKWHVGAGDGLPALKNHLGVINIEFDDTKEFILVTVKVPYPYGTDSYQSASTIKIPVKYFNMTEEEIGKEEERDCNLRIEAYRKEAERRAEEEERQKEIRAEEKEKHERELYEQLKKKYG